MLLCAFVSLIGANVVPGCMTASVSKPVVMVRQLIAKICPAWQCLQRKQWTMYPILTATPPQTVYYDSLSHCMDEIVHREKRGELNVDILTK